jgi:hypothetical protein
MNNTYKYTVYHIYTEKISIANKLVFHFPLCQRHCGNCFCRLSKRLSRWMQNLSGTVLTVSRVLVGLIDKKTEGQKSRDRVPLNSLYFTRQQCTVYWKERELGQLYVLFFLIYWRKNPSFFLPQVAVTSQYTFKGIQWPDIMTNWDVWYIV